MRAIKWAARLLVALAVLFVVFFGQLRGPLTRAVTNATGRELSIEGDLRIVPSWVHPRFRAEGVTFANADWGEADHLLKAEAVEVTVAVLPLLRGKVVLPEVHLQHPEVFLEQDEEGRRNWILNPDEPGKESRIHIRRLTLDEGVLGYDDAGTETRVRASLSTDESGMRFDVKGRYRGLAAAASGRGGPVMLLRDESTPYPLKAEAKIGNTRARVDGTITEIIGLAGIDARIEVSGRSMEELYGIVGVAFPSTSPYTTSGRLVRERLVTRYENFTGKVGESDIAGSLSVDRSGKRPFMRGDLVSKVLDLADLGALVGTNQPAETGVLPDMPFDPQRWESVDADVRVRAGTIERPAQLPLENLGARVQMRDRVMTLGPLEFGIAGGKLAGPVRLDGTRDTIRADAKIKVRKLQLAKLFPTIEQSQASLGDITGAIDLVGQGNSVKQMLGSSSGAVGVYIDDGQVSQFLMELVALDLWGITQVKLKGDEPVKIRCAIADFGIKDGIMQTNAFVFDTEVVVIDGEGAINLKTEEMDLELTPRPKQKSIASLNSPLYVRGTFMAPQVSPDVGRLAAKGLGAVVMGVLNPLLAVIPLVNEGPGKDSNCGQLIAEVTEKTKAARAKASAAAGASSAPSPASGATAQPPAPK